MTKIQSFELDGVRFAMDFRPGPDRGKSTIDEFVLVKTPAFLEHYRKLQSHNPKKILEIGMFEGGSLVYFDKLYKPDTLVGLDVRDQIGPLEAYRAERPHIHTLYGQSQDDPTLPSVLGRYFPDGIDLIVDDASHLYEPTRAAFHLCFPLLRPGGLYVIEDWSWAHQQPYQEPSHPWHDRAALTNLLFELILNIASRKDIHEITTYPELVVVKKARHPSNEIDLGEAQARLRGRRLSLI